MQAPTLAPLCCQVDNTALHTQQEEGKVCKERPLYCNVIATHCLCSQCCPFLLFKLSLLACASQVPKLCQVSGVRAIPRIYFHASRCHACIGVRAVLCVCVTMCLIHNVLRQRHAKCRRAVDKSHPGVEQLMTSQLCKCAIENFLPMLTAPE